jgi:hypothetical protein
MKTIDAASLPANVGNPNYFTGDVTLRPIPAEGAVPV